MPPQDFADYLDQQSYIRTLEKRLRDLEQRVRAMEGEIDLKAGPSNCGSGNGRAESGNEQGQEDAIQPHENENNGRHNLANVEPDSHQPPEPPALPPIVSKVRKLNYLGYHYRAVPASYRAAIEVLYFYGPGKEVQETNDTFRKSLADATPAMSLEMIRNAAADSSQLPPNAAEIRINSKSLSQLLMLLIYGHDGSLAGPLTMDRPFAVPIFYHDNVKRKLLDIEASATESEINLLEELRCYVSLMEEILAFYTRFRIFSAVDNFKVYYLDLWHLFEPGQTIFYPEATANPCALDYLKLKRTKHADQKLWRVYTRMYQNESFRVKAYCIGYDGESLICHKEWFEIDYYQGAASVTSLKVYPVRFAHKAEELLADSVRSGKRFRDFFQTKLVAHDGWAFEPNDGAQTLRYITGDVVVDFAETFKANPSWKPVSEWPGITYKGDRGSLKHYKDPEAAWYWSDGERLRELNEPQWYWSESQVHRLQKIKYCCNQDPFLSSHFDKQNGSYEIQEEDYHLLPSKLFGYSLQDRRFVSVSVANVKPIQDPTSRFQDLIIDPDHERLLHALVRSHFARKQLRDSTAVEVTNQDIIQNKGKGLVILLHGVPGVGKTSTAETMAIEFGKPLLPITCGDLGLDPEAVEKSLKELFRLAQTWDCVLLLDEADVFLTERIPSDLKRNALVSVFLRVLDYYSGVLFLTTNRVGTIDEAFKSRIHTSLYYPPLSKDQSEKIWAMNLKRVAQIEDEKCQLTNETPFTIDHEGIMKFARDHYQKGKQGKDGRSQWNGRQIRNAFLIASALARYDKSDLSQQNPDHCCLGPYHFKLVVKSGLGFERYLYKVKGMTDGEMAFVQGVRADHANVNVNAAKGSSETDQGPARNIAARPITSTINASPHTLHQWPNPYAHAHTQPYNTHHENSPMPTQTFLSPGIQSSNLQPHQHPQYMMEPGYHGQMGDSQMGMRPNSHLPVSSHGHTEQPGYSYSFDDY